MGAWGTSVFSDDLAADVRDEFRDLIGDGLTTGQAVKQLLARYSESLTDPDERAVFWIALAVSQWKLGRLDERTKREALSVIDSEQDLQRFDLPSDRKKRQRVLEKVRQDLLSPQPEVKKVPRSVKAQNDWAVGEVVAFRLLSGCWTLLRVVGHHSDRGGTFPICELLDWSGEELPSTERISGLRIRTRVGGSSRFLLQLPKKTIDLARFKRPGISTSPVQAAGGYAIVLWKYVDETLKEWFGIE